MFSSKKLAIKITPYDSIKQMFEKEIVFDGYAVDCEITKVMSKGGYTASVNIYNVPESLIDQITTINWRFGYITNKKLEIYSVTDNTMELLFEGGIMYAVPDYTKVPEVSVHIESSAFVFPNSKSVSSSTFGNTSVYSIVKGICSDYGVKSSIDISLLAMLTYGSYIFDQETFAERLHDACRMFELEYDYTNGIVNIYKAGKSGHTKKLSPNEYTGYPTLNNTGITVTLNDLLDIRCGQQIEIEGSQVGPANGKWNVYIIKYKLQSYIQGGKWEMNISGTRVL